MKLELPTTKLSYKLPEILSASEVASIIKATKNIKHKALLMVVYGAGLRISEALNLRISDIDKSRMTLHIRDCKNKRDRFVILSKVVYKVLCEYWRHCRFQDYLFPGQQTGNQMTIMAASLIYRKAKARAGVTKPGGIHGLRHAFATHMLEAKENLFVIKKLLGHSSIRSTERYLKFIPDRDTKIQSPIDLLAL